MDFPEWEEYEIPFRTEQRGGEVVILEQRLEAGTEVRTASCFKQQQHQHQQQQKSTRACPANFMKSGTLLSEVKRGYYRTAGQVFI